MVPILFFPVPFAQWLSVESLTCVHHARTHARTHAHRQHHTWRYHFSLRALLFEKNFLRLFPVVSVSRIFLSLWGKGAGGTLRSVSSRCWCIHDCDSEIKKNLHVCVCLCVFARACVCVFSCLGGVPLAHGPPINIKEALFSSKHSCKDNKLLLLALRTLRTIAFWNKLSCSSVRGL